ncbi:MAG: sensor histidine kinase [Gammaproteobacteria bacterium]
MRFTLTKRLLLGVAIALAAGLLVIALLFTALNAVRKSLHTVTEVEFAASEAALEMEIGMLGAGLGLMDFLATGEQLFRDRGAQYRLDFERFRAQYARLADTAQSRALAERIGALYQEYTALAETLMQKRDTEERGLLSSAEYRRFLDLRTEMDDLLDEAIQYRAGVDLVRTIREADESYDHVIRTLALGVPLFILSALGAAWLMRRQIAVPARRLLAGMEALGQGDLNRRIDYQSTDELGMLAGGFNAMAAQLDATTLRRDLLEQRVLERTTELASVNKALQEEIAERERGEKRLQALSVELERSNRELQDFAFIASHDLQEPLRKIRAFGDRLHTRYRAVLDAEGRDYLDRMQNAARRMHTLITDLLAFSRVMIGGQPFEPVDLSRVAEEVVSDLEGRLLETGGRVLIETLPAIPADPLQMRQLLQNLIGNALKFHRPGEPPLVRLRGELEDPGPDADAGASVSCRITVEDNGIGFETKFTDRIFTPFQRLHGREDYEGTGMGLAICRKIVERHGGTITASSTPGQGATFVVTLPIQTTVGG